MPLGDSITNGAYSIFDSLPFELRTGYRQPLYLALRDAGYVVDFVGGLRYGELATPTFDPDHEGHGGWRDDQVAAQVHSWLTANPADIILLHIGTNSVDTSSNDVRNILDEIDRFSTAPIVLLARIINRMTYDPVTTAFNDNVEAMARQRIAEGDKIVIVDMESALDDPSYYSDDKHPDAAGYEIMAGVWYQTLTGILSLQDVPPQITSTPITFAQTGVSYVYAVTANGYPFPSYALADAPPGMTIDAESGVIEWTPDTSGTWEVTVEAANYLGAAQQTYLLSVVEAAGCSAGLVSYWPLDETSGSVYADVFGGRNGLCAGGGCPAATTGQVLGGQSFGTATGISAPADAAFDWGAAESFSVEFWMRRSGAPEGTEVMVGRDAAESKVQWWSGIDHSQGDVARFYLRDRGGRATGVSGSTNISDGAWHHVAAVRDAASSLLRIYVDGVEENSAATNYTGGFDSALASVDVGWINLGSGYHYRGLVDEVALYNRALTPVEIQDHYSSGLLGEGYCANPSDSVAPSFVTDPPLTAALGGSYVYDADAGGIPAPVYSLDQSPEGMTIDPASGLIEWSVNNTGSFPVSVLAVNTAGTATQSFTIQVNAVVLAPRITSSPTLSVNLGNTYTYDVEADGAPAPAFALAAAPPGMTIDGTSGLITWLPGAAGSYGVTVEASNSDGADSQSFTVAVTEIQSGGCSEELVSYWTLDETSGSLYADVIGGKNGLCSSDGCPAPAAGQVQGAQFFGVNSAVSVEPDAAFDWGVNDSFSIEFWMRRSGIPTGNEVVVGRNESGTKLQWWAGIDHSRGDVARFYLQGTTGKGVGVSSTTILADGAWHHVAAVRDAVAGRLKIYVDGVEEGSALASFGSGFNSPTAHVNIGWLNLGGGYHFLGLADEAAIHGRALSAEEIQEHYASGLAGKGYCDAAPPAEAAPSITSDPLLSANLSGSYAYDVDAVGVPTPSYILTSAPPGMTIDSSSGLIAWTPTSSGSFDVVVEAVNAVGKDIQSFTVTVAEALSCPTGLISYWTLDEAAGPLYSDIISGKDGQCAGGGCPDAVAGLVFGGQSFGSSTGIAVLDDAAFDWGVNDSFSIEFWMRRTGAPSRNEVIVGRDETGSKLQWWVGIDHDGGDSARFYLRNRSGKTAAISGVTFLPDGGWHHVAAVRDAGAGRLRIYVDGVEEGSTAANFGSGFESSAPLTIGWLSRGNGYHYFGFADEAAIYGRALTLGEIQQHFNDGLVGRGYCGD
jgi:hypothetical protein